MALGTSNNELTHYTWEQQFQRSFITTQSNKLGSVQVFTHNYLTSGARCWWRSWLRQCATSQKVAGSILDGVIGFFN